MSGKRIVVLGGYGNFGKRICESLSLESTIVLIIAGRTAERAVALQQRLQAHGASAIVETAVVDLEADNFSEQLVSLNPHIVIHTAGPFQNQGYIVPRACIAAGSHYIDLADDRRFVCDISDLDDFAKERGVLIVSGASSVPGLSSAVVKHFSNEFLQLDFIDIAIAPGNQAERGLATLRAVLSYTGHAISVFSSGKWLTQYGWMSARRWDFGPIIGRRWLANVDVPDLELFPAYFNVRRRVRFQAGLELVFLHLTMLTMAQLSKWGVVKDWSVYADSIFALSRRFDGLGSDTGGMRIELQGIALGGNPKTINWVLSASGGIGPYIPTLAAIVITKKLLSCKQTETGAMPCIGLFDLQEFDVEAIPLGIVHSWEQTDG